MISTQRRTASLFLLPRAAALDADPPAFARGLRDVVASFMPLARNVCGKKPNPTIVV